MTFNPSAWGNRVGELVVTAPTTYPDIPFVSKGNLRDLQLRCFGLTHSGGAPSDWIVEVSNDNGANWISTVGYYERFGAAGLGNTSFVFATAVGAGQPVNAVITLYGFNSWERTMARIKGGRVNTASGLVQVPGNTTVEETLSALRIRTSNNDTINGGVVYLYGRQGQD